MSVIVITHLRNAVARSIEERIGADVPQFFKSVADVFRNDFVAIVQNIWNIFHQQRYGFQFANEAKVLQVEFRPGIM